MGGWGNRVSFPDPELGSGRPGEAGVGCSFRRLFHVAVGKTRKARQRAPCKYYLVPRHRVLAKPIRKKVLEGARTVTLWVAAGGGKEVTAETADEKVIFRGL